MKTLKSKKAKHTKVSYVLLIKIIFSITEIPSHTHRHQHGSNTNKVMFKDHLLFNIFKLIELRNILTLGLGTIPKLYKMTQAPT